MWWWLACAEPVDPGARSGPLPAQPEVVLEVLELVDPSRGHDAYPGLAATDERRLTTWVWLPPGEGAALEDRPVLLLAHGNSGHPELLAPFAEAFAERGAVVVAPVFPVTAYGGATGGLGLADLVNQPDDLDVVLDAVLAGSREPGSFLHRRVDGGRVVAVGHSLGGATVGAWTLWRAPRPEVVGAALVAPAAFLLDPVFGDGPGDGPPLQLVHGSADSTVAPSNSASLFSEVGAPAAWVEVDGAAHSDLIEGEGPRVDATVDVIGGAFDAWAGEAWSAWGLALGRAEARGDAVADRGVR